MIDIHCHILYGVDDGAKDIEESLNMLEEAESQGLTNVILTPHYRRTMFETPIETIETHFGELQQMWQANPNRTLKLHLGCECHIDSEAVENFRSGRCKTLAGGSYVLAEYSHLSEFADIRRSADDLLMNGYTPVIAHAERYECLTRKLDRLDSLGRMGCMIQVNTDSVLGLEGHAVKSFCKKLLKERMVDLIASDAHNLKDRAIHMKECYEYVKRRIDEAYADEVFRRNGLNILFDIN